MERKPRRKKRRTTTAHRGVKLLERTLASGTTIHLARWTDPDTGKAREASLDKLGLTTNEARRAWAIALSQELLRRKADRAAGVRPVESSALEQAIRSYLDTARSTLKPKTLEGHELAITKLREWASSAGVKSTADLTPAKLAALRDFLICAPRRGVKRGGKQGARVPTAQRRSPVTVNRELRSLKTLLNTWRTRGQLAGLHRDDIADALCALPTPREEPPFLRTTELRALLASALRHDAATFDATREEHAGLRPVGTTPRYDPIAPFLAFVLLTGMRRSEALATTWSMVDLDAPDHEGRTVGEIRLPAAATKTDRARTIGLEVSPALRRVLAALKLRGGGVGHVFGGVEPYTVDVVEKARRRMASTFGGPAFDWQTLRSTCATYLTNAPGIFGAATVFLSARQLGHSVQVAERHYLGVHRGIPREARTLEAAMQIEAELADVLGAIVTRAERPARRASS